MYDDKIQELVEAVILRAVMDYYEDPKQFPDALTFVRSCPFGISQETATTIERGMLRGVKPKSRYRDESKPVDMRERLPIRDEYLRDAARLRQYLREKGLGQRAFAKLTGVSQGAISNMCTARRELTPEIVAVLNGGRPP